MVAPTFEPPRVLPLAVVLRGRRCVVVGGGPRALPRVAELIAGGAVICIVAPVLCAELAALVRGVPTVSWHERTFRPNDVEGAHLVVAATNDPSVDQRVFDEAEARGSWVHCPDDPERCSVYAMAHVRRGPVAVAVSTSGTSPALASYLRGWLDARLDGALGDVAMVLSEVRRELLDDGASTEGRAWRHVVDDELVAMVAAGGTSAAKARVEAAVHRSSGEP